MFTGLVQGLGHGTFLDRHHLHIRYLTPPAFAATTQPGDSIAVDGICLTVERCNLEGFVAATSPETLARTTLGRGDRSEGGAIVVNLEPALRAGDKIGGHFVSGHIDGLGYLETAENLDPFWNLAFRVPVDSPLPRYLVPKGSIAINGVSLTIAHCTPDFQGFSIAVIPLTYQETNLHRLQPGDPVNLEGDILGKYVEKFMMYPRADSGATGPIAPTSPVDFAFLQEHGYH